MKVFKRIITSIVRKPQQSILMFLIVFMLGNVLFASIAIKQASEDVRMELRARIPSNIVLLQKSSLNAEQSERMSLFLDELSSNENVKQIETEAYYSIESADLYRNGAIPDVYSIDSTKGYESNEFIEEGRFFTQEELDNGSNKIVLSSDDYKFSTNYKGENYKVGDVYRIYLYDYVIQSRETRWGLQTFTEAKPLDELSYIDYEIIGYFVSNGPNISMNVETCMPEKAAEQLLSAQKEVFDAHSSEDKEKYNMDWNSGVEKNISKITIYSKGIDANKALDKEIRENKNFIGSRYTIDSAEADYSYIEAPLENLVALTNVTLIGSIVMIVLLLSLISMLFIRTRTKEIGILMALGEKKINIIMQFVAEIVLVGLLATSLSMISGQKLGDFVSQEFMKIQIDTDAETDYAEDNPDEVTRLDLLDAYQVEMNTEYIIQIYIASFIVLSCSSIVPIMNITKVNPKKILL